MSKLSISVRKVIVERTGPMPGVSTKAQDGSKRCVPEYELIAMFREELIDGRQYMKTF